MTQLELQTQAGAISAPVGESVLDVQGLVKRYGGKTAVNGVSFQVRRGEIFGLLGPNGAGKTTTLEMIEGIHTPDGGTAIIGGLDIRKQKRAVQRMIGVQLQATSLFPELNVQETIQFFGSVYPRALKAKDLLALVNLSEKARAFPQDLSGGQRQRLALALALVNDPQLIFLDEPTAGLDPQSRRMLWETVLSLREQGKTVMLTTHYMDEAQVLCDRIAILDQGQIIALDTAAGLIGRLGAQSTIDCKLDGTTKASEISELAGVAKVREANGRFVLQTRQMEPTLLALLRYATERGSALTDLQVRTPTLEDVFLDLTGHELRPEQA
jgi:ABC-2 type transport system ATP-binding protein